MLPNKKMLKLSRAAAWRLSQLPSEKKGNIHYGVFLLCFGAGLRVSEAISFDYQKRVNEFYVVQSKNHQERKVAVSKSIVQELKANNFTPHQTNRFNFANFCKRVKKEANLLAEVELTPHTGRRSWATHQAENGVPLPILSKMLGHKQLETTAQYYWREVYSPTESEQIQLTAQTSILDSVKDKKFWKEYNAKRKEYLRKKNKENYSEFKKTRQTLSEKGLLNQKKQRSKTINTTNSTTYAQQLANPFKSTGPPRSRLEMSR